MRITDLLDKRSISLDAVCASKSDALDQAVALMVKSGKINDEEAYRKQVYLREEESTTGIGEGIAIPHGKCDAVTKPGLAAMVIKDGVDFDSLDDEPVNLLFLIAAPNTEDNIHLDVLSKLSMLLMDENFVEKLKNASSVDEFLEIVDAADEEIANADCVIVAADAKVPMDRFDGKKLIEVPVSDGISKADQLVERAISGDAPIYHSSNAGSQSTASKKASGGIGHRLYVHLMNGVSHMLPFVVGGGILIAIAFLIDGMNVDINSLSADMRANFGTITPVAAAFKQIGGIAFGLMLPVLAGFIAMSIGDRPALAVGFVGGMIAANGKSGFLGALAAGFLAGLIILLLKKVFSRLPDALEKITPVLLYPVCGILLMGLIMMFVIEPPVGALNTALNTALTNMGASSKILLGIICAGMMAIDMGGPFNKAAYVFGTAAIVAGNYDIMAAVMIGGMVPPCAIALATLLFKNKFTKEERKSGPVNFIMGLAFITEGAIPYAAADPIRVLPSCVVGSAVAGALSMAFGCTLMAPHGGIFVVPVMGNAGMYLVALAVGTVISAVLLGLLKKKVNE